MLINFLKKIVFFILKFSLLTLLFMTTIGTIIGVMVDKSISLLTSLMFILIFGSLFCWLFWRWVLAPLFKKHKKETKKGSSTKNNLTFIEKLDNVNEQIKSLIKTNHPKKDNEIKGYQVVIKNNQSISNIDESYSPRGMSKIIYSMENGEALIWRGETKPASFRLFNETQKTEGIITKLALHEDGEFYLDIVNTQTGELSKIKESEINNKILIGSTRYDFVELCRKVFKLDLRELFEYAKSVRFESSEPKIINSFKPILTTFTYASSSGKNRRTVAVSEYLKNARGQQYIQGFCQMRNERRMFAASQIQTMLTTEGHKKYHFNDWLINVAGIEP